MTSPYSAGHDHAMKKVLLRQRLEVVKEELERRRKLRRSLYLAGLANSTEGYKRPYRWWPRRRK